MVPGEVAAADVLRALKKFKRLAKQDILASRLTSDPDFWQAQAEARREVYDRLMEKVKEEGVAAAYEMAAKAYAELPLLRSQDGGTPSPTVSGHRQALELFFHLLGAEVEALEQEPTGEAAATAAHAGTDAGMAGESPSAPSSAPSVIPSGA